MGPRGWGPKPDLLRWGGGSAPAGKGSKCQAAKPLGTYGASVELGTPARSDFVDTTDALIGMLAAGSGIGVRTGSAMGAAATDGSEGSEPGPGMAGIMGT